MQKYVNSPDSEIYHKGNELFGLNQAKQAIRKDDRVILVEGQADVITMSQSSVENVVAGSGTALTLQQIRKLHRFTNNITLIYDGDEAGVSAALRNSDLIHGEGMNVSVLFLPDGQDPDDFAKSHSAEELRKFIAEKSTDSILFRIDRTITGVTDPIKRSQAINDVVNSIAIIKDPILRDTYVRECSQRTGVPETTLIAQMNRVIHKNREASPNSPNEERMHSAVDNAYSQVQNASSSSSVPGTTKEASGNMSQATRVEQMLLEMVVRHGNEIIFRGVENQATGEKINLTVAQYIAYDLGLDNLSFSSQLYNDILHEAVEKSGDPSFVSVSYFANHPDIRISTLASSLGAEKYQLSESLQIKNSEESLREQVMHMILDFRFEYVNRHLKELQKEIFITKEPVRQMQIMAEIKKMQDVRNILAKKLGSNIVV